MIYYYVKNESAEVILADTDKAKLLTTMNLMPQYKGSEVKKIIFEGGITPEDYNNDIDAGGDKYLLDTSVTPHVVSLRPLTPEEIAVLEEAEREKQIAEIEQQFVEYMDTPIVCPLNGKSYKPKWADDGTYLKVIQSFDLLEATGVQNPTIKIWDATELEENTALMTKADLIRLITFLYDQAQPVYEQKKQAVAELKKAAAGEIEECSDVPEEGPEL